MATSTNLISGLASGFDWQGMVEQLIKIEHRKVDLMEKKKTEYENKLAEWQQVNTQLLSLKTVASALATDNAFKVFTSSMSSTTSTSASDLLSVSVDSAASAGTYNIKINQLAQSEKISSQSYTATDTALSLSGDILISGRVVTITATDTLVNIQDKINAVNTGAGASKVTAGIVQHSATDYHLVLSSDETGEEGINILEASSGNVLRNMGFIDYTVASIKNATSNGARSDLFTDTNTAVGTLLDLTSPPGPATVTIGGNALTVDLSTESITTIASNINALGSGVTASVVSETDDEDIVRYRIQISGTTSFTDSGNVLQTLGILRGNYGQTTKVLTGSIANTTDGSSAITAATQWDQIYGADVKAGTSFTLTGKDHVGKDVSGAFTISGTTTTVQELLTYIETTLFDGTVTAAIDGSGKLQVTDATSGDSRLELTLRTNNPTGGSLDFGTIATSTEGREMRIAEGKNALITLDNVIIEKSSNEISDVIPGVTLNLSGYEASTTINLKIERDYAGIKSKIKTMVDAYNSIMNYIKEQFTYNEESKKTGGILFGDGTLSSLKSEMINIVTKTISGLSSDFNRLPLIGISLNDQAQLTIDDSKLTEALKSSFNDVRKLFVADGSAGNPLLTYVSHTDSTENGSYAVNITRAATQTTVAGSASLAGALGSDETLSITDFNLGRTAEVSLTAGMTLADIVNAVNSEVNKTYTERLQGSTATGHTSAATFSDIGAQAGDTITFSGTRRNGLMVSGSYKVTDTSDTLADLLGAVSDMFEGDVTVSLSGAGNLTITDKQSGDSRLSFSIDTSDISGFSFGTIGTLTEGRYEVPITASADAGGHLVLTHNTYGTGHVMVISESGGAALGMNTAEQVYGVNVAGTINGIEATGEGQTLTLSSSDNDADGLTIMYTGTGTASTTMNLTLGMADLFERRLKFLTDTDGTISFKQTSLQSSIDSYESRIEEMEAFLARKQETMTNRFVVMETMLSRLSSQSSWLSSQIAALQSNWFS